MGNARIAYWKGSRVIGFWEKFGSNKHRTYLIFIDLSHVIILAAAKLMLYDNNPPFTHI